MIQQVLLPKLGETMTEATVEKWHKAEGDSVRKGDVLLEITTDKATLEVESLAAGTMRKVLAPQGAVLAVNTVLALVGEPGDALPANLAELEALARGEKAAAASAPKKSVVTAVAVSAEPEAAPLLIPIAAPAGRIFASPRARRKAREEKAPLAVLRGSGPGGRIVEKDVLAWLARREQVKSTPAAIAVAFERGVDITSIKGTGPGGKVSREDVLAAKPAAAPAAAGRIELTAMRRVVADRMTKSKREAPHFYLVMEIDMTAAAALRSKLNTQGTVRIAFHDMVLRACALALQENPAMNVTWGGDHIRRRAEVNLGLAVALDEGLMVPVVKGCDRMTLPQLAQASARLVERARSKKLTPDEYEGGCLTLSNLGMFDVESFLPVINPGESGILGVGRIAPKAIVLDGGIHIRSMMTCTLSADHRSVDGAIAAKFLKAVKDHLEKPEGLA